MELLNKEETLYRISDKQERTKKDILAYKLNRSLKDIPADWHNRTFADFDNTELKQTADKLKQWDFKNPNTAGIISQMNGIGKTHLATCIYKKYIYENFEKQFDKIVIDHSEDVLDNLQDWIYWNHDFNILFLSEKKLALIIQETFNQKSKTQLDVLEYYCNLDFLIIDDCFAMKQNEFARQNIFYIIDERTEWKNKPTFITSNLSLSEIADIDTRIADRIRTSYLFQIKDKINSFRSGK